MRMNHVEITAPDLDAAWVFYGKLGLVPIVDSRPRYVRFLCPDSGGTFSVAHGEAGGGGTTVYFEVDDLDERVSQLKIAGVNFASEPEDKRWLWREAELSDPAGNRIVLYFAGKNRINPPWRIPG
ncbi:VOC family protein [Phyllobacterium sp. 628]|uniref:VOC family protein n=1 Tax=Phyllobacterium sp. 628 TaxID=2718938 RepID=UPI001662576E|nr:VOC family protein [Phyllobacterium sp. 628]QND51145.1 VOC family protein [Phyllobacterium sp. 628]